MKIGFDIRPLMDENYSGVSIYTFNLLREILKQDSVNTYKLFYNSFKNKEKNIPLFEQPNVEITATSYPNKILNYLFFRTLNRPRIDRKAKVDLFFMPHLNFIAFSKKTKNIVVVHDLSFLHYPYFFTRRQNFWHKALKIKKLLQNASVIIAVSENTKNDIINFYNIPERKIKVIYSGVGAEFKLIDKQDNKFLKLKQQYNLPEKFMLYLGNVEPRKNIESILEAYIFFRNENPEKNIGLVIAGSSAWKNKIVKTMAQNCHYKKDIYFLGYVKNEDKPYLYNLAEIFLFPSFYEGFGFPPLEAAACGTPVITSNTSSLPEIMRENAILINPHDITELKDAMLQILQDENLAEKMRVNGIRHAQKYSWEKCAREVIETFGSVL